MTARSQWITKNVKSHAKKMKFNTLYRYRWLNCILHTQCIAHPDTVLAASISSVCKDWLLSNTTTNRGIRRGILVIRISHIIGISKMTIEMNRDVEKIPNFLLIFILLLLCFAFWFGCEKNSIAIDKNGDENSNTNNTNKAMLAGWQEVANEWKVFFLSSKYGALANWNCAND